ncbi:ATP-dependent DNA ligase [Eremomyces bilateralis CBS 781.70]|uniref:DNA ligase n=1 Tax=Eremomyces bilateralis CBS 781.70 TaxID=1392243 RepID=A0A6G1G468_9PEZI|nr:ATP-dependent DNA ligase [Eremomyces bilateralis CBS 781.70]KAF1812619.1 ATP-dependent DNA ligase [Eremomyces bilateralis CBS 781.70]
MPSPAKRRKKNDFKSADQSVRGLDYFFAKQQANKGTPSSHGTGEEKPTCAERNEVTQETDEEYARRLQEQYDKEEQGLGISRSEAEDGIPNGTTSRLKSVEVPKAGSSERKPLEPTIRTLSLQHGTTAADKVTFAIPLDEDPLTFDLSTYISPLQAQWSSTGGNATYALLTHCFTIAGSTTGRIKTTNTLINTFRLLIAADPDSLLPAVWLSTNSISAPHDPMELNLGGSTISKALCKVYSLTPATLRTLYNKYGDGGDVAFEAKKRASLTLRKPKPLTVQGVYDDLGKIAKSTGKGSAEMKQGTVERMIRDAGTGEESRYLVRTLVQNLRIGAVKTTTLIALSRAFLLTAPPHPPESFTSAYDPTSVARMSKDARQELFLRAEELLKASYARHPSYATLVPALLEVGISPELLLRCGLSLHVPLRPMLGAITRDLPSMLAQLAGRAFTAEWKYDGQRAQVHCDDAGTVSIFSRHLENMTDKYPDLVSLVPQFRGEGVSSFILEGEVVAVNPETGQLLPFQTLSNRARKDVKQEDVKVQVCLYAFDLMYLNGSELLGRPLRERRNILKSLFNSIPRRFEWVRNLDATSEDVESVREFFQEATNNKCEGIMVKVLDNLDEDIKLAEQEDLIDGDVPSIPTRKKAKPAKGKEASKPSKAADESAENASEARPSRRKPLLATYTPDKRLESWLKVKKDYAQSADTIDMIPIGAWHGQGRKSKWWSPILLAVRNESTGLLEAVTKCMSGFTDKFYKENRAKYDPDGQAGGPPENEEDDDSDDLEAVERIGKNTLASKPMYVEYNGPEPDIWFEPQEVWECVFADVTLSPTYTAAIGLVSDERGLSLRFPRFLRVREDKSIEEASTSEFLAELYRKQAGDPDRPSAEKMEVEEEAELDDDGELYG